MRGIILAALLLSGCATAGSAPPVTAQQATVVKTICLPLKAYAEPQEKAVAAELQKLPADDPLAGFVTDYGQMRAADRACIGK